jgi:TetR/AcrR family tetracycline transcriptional repressor
MAKAELNRDAIVARALEIADTEGLPAITIRRLSKEFGVTPMALYWHVENKDELLAAMGDALFADIPVEVDPALDWHEQLRELELRLVTALRAHPGAADLAFERVLLCDVGRRLAEAVFDLLRNAGFSVRDTAGLGAQALRSAVALVAGEPGREFAGSAAERERLLAGKRAAMDALPAEQFPRLREMADALVDCDDQDEYYRLGVDLYVAGVTKLAAGAAAQSLA